MGTSGTLEKVLALAEELRAKLIRSGIASYHPLAIAAILTALSLILACPDYKRFQPYAGMPWAYQALQWKFEHPLQPIPVQAFAPGDTRDDIGAAEHLEKRSFRIAVPLAAYLLHVGIKGALLGQQLAAYGFLVLTVIVGRRLTGSDLSGMLIGGIFASSFIGQWGFNDFHYFDGFAYLSILVCIWSHSPVIIALTTALGGMIDERVLLAAPLTYLCLPLLQPSNGSYRIDRLMRPDRHRQALIFGVLLAGASRVLLAWYWGGRWGNTAGIAFTDRGIRFLPLSLILVAKGLCLPLGFAAVAAIANSRYLIPCLTILASVPILVLSALVYDTARSLGYAFPAFLLVLAMLARSLSVRELQYFLLAAAVCNVVIPTYYAMFGVLFVLPPIVRLLSPIVRLL